MSNGQYTEKDIITLTEVESIRQNPGMYIGSTVNPNHLLYEALDNALDEANAGYADLILVSVDNKNSIFTIADNGRGIPFKDDTIIKITTKLFTGGKFKKGETSSSYKAAIGMHGVGLVAVNALSEWMEVLVYRDNKKVYYRFEDCKVVKHTEEDFDCSKKPCSTCIKFKPIQKYFESIKIDTEPVRTRLELASVHIDKLRLISVVDGKKEVIKMTMEDYFNKNYFGETDVKNISPMFNFVEQIKGEELRIVFGWDMNKYCPSVTGGCINILPVKEGTHIASALSVFQTVFDNIAKKEKLSYNPRDFMTGFRMFVSMELYHTDFTSQSKEKFSTSKSKLEFLFKNAVKKIEELLRENDEVFNKIVYYVDSYRKSLTTKKTIVKNTGSINRYNTNIDAKLKDCTSTEVEKCELFITEGDSASGGLVQCRNPKFHAILGLRGKVPNLGSKSVNYLTNKEFVEIINALGTGCGKDFDITKRRYGKLIIATDADVDGDHISVLLITAILRMFPDIIKAGIVYKAIMPKYGVRNFEGKFLPFYTEEEMLKFKQEHPNIEITRYKGLGEMMPNQLKDVLLNPNIRRLKQIKSDEDFEPIFKLMTDSESKRNLILDE